MLILLNTYPLLVSQNLVFKSKAAGMTGSVKVIESALSGLERLTEENVGQALSGMEETGVSRILVTDTAGRILFDSRESGGAQGLYAFYTEVVQALRGNDAVFCTYDDAAFISRMASPVVYHNQIVGAVYAYEYDAEQADLFKSFQSNLLKISGIIALAVLVLSVVLSRVLTAQIGELLAAIRHVREGAYTHRAAVKGNDEISQIATEFNSLTHRLQTTENARRRFVSDASHELKTPLAGIRLLTDSILHSDDMDSDTTREFVSDIGREAERLTRITENLLRLTRLDSAVVPEAERVEVCPVLDRVVRMLSMVARDHNITLTHRCDPRAAVMATEDDLHQILYNLMENGIKYSTAHPEILINTQSDKKYFLLSVTDKGIGIPKKALPNIFDNFYRVPKGNVHDVKGYGLGLGYVKKIIALHHGHIEVQSEEGKGSTFVIYLPLKH